jgi:two-component system, OmpR family, phosphate regulon sensor histidine kinase PhoR
MSLDLAWRKELLLLAGGLLWLALIGWLAGQLLTLLLAGVTAYLGWHLVQLYRFTQWLDRPKHHPPPIPFGIWHALRWEAEALRDRAQKRKEKLSRMLTGFHESTSALPDATVVFDDRGVLEWWNSTAAEMLALDRKRDKARLIQEVLTDPVLRHYLAGGDFTRPLQMPAPVDDSISLEVRVVPYGAGKRLLQARDISRLQQLETVRRDFVANVSHEMRTPLTVVLGYLETMADSEDPRLAHWLQIVRQMQQQTARMQRIVEDLLLLSRVESGATNERQELVDVPALLENIREEALGLSGELRHELVLDVDRSLKLSGNTAELDSAFSNLTINAVRYTPAGGKIRLRWWVGLGGPVFSVQDTGIGIEAKHIPRLTERFYRVDVARSRSSGGTGLGLAIVKHVLTRHGGRLEIKSEPGKGSTFSCFFPKARTR